MNDNTAVVERLEALQPEGLGLSVVALAELYEGVYYKTSTPAGSESGVKSIHPQKIMVIGSDEYRKMLDGAIAGLVFAWLYDMFVGV